ncbi:MAG: glycosyltransferase family 4 protein [Roseburia sp.]|nr:glycosyltransferase family 4 protein [Roseburia sp.]
MHNNNIQKNIMYIFNDTGFGGAGQSLLDTLSEIKSEINPIVIIQAGAEVENNFTELGIKCYRIPFATDYVKIGSAGMDKKKQDVIQSYEAALQLLPIIQKEEIQLIHINSSVSSFAAIAALMAHIPYIWHIRELLQEQFGCEFLNEELKISLFQKADKRIAISDYVQKQYEKKYGLETYRLYNGLNIKRFKRDEVIREKFDKVFIAAAMITPEKGQWDIIQAAEHLVEKGHDDIKVIIVGNGSSGYVWALNKYIKRKKLENNIHILPFQEDLSQLRSCASYAITSSQNEALGRVTIEAMLAGNIVIGAKSGGTTEIIGSNEEGGFLYELGNSKSLADTMERAINCTEEQKNILVCKAQKYAENTFDSKQYCVELLRIYNETIEAFESYNYDEFLNTLKAYYTSISELKDFNRRNTEGVLYRKSALMFPVALKWLEIRQNGHSFSEYFKQNHIHSIAIYGMGALGCRLYDELENSDIEIRYLLDKNPNGMDKIFEFSWLDSLELDADAIVVTVILSEKQIISEIKKLGYDNVIGLSTVIDSLVYNMSGKG